MTQRILNTFGNSITYGVAASIPANAYVSLTGSAMQWAINNHAVSGDEAGDQADAIYNVAPIAGFRSLYMIGVNNQRHFNLNPVNLASFQSTLMAQAAWLAILNSDLILGSAAAYTGTGWNVATAYNSMGKYTDTAGDYYEYSIPAGSSVIYVATIQQDTSTGAEEVFLDGVSQGSYLVAPASAITTTLGRAYMPKLYRIDGVNPATSHVVRVTKSNASAVGSRIYSGWCWGNGMKTVCQYPKLVLCTPTPFGLTGYSVNGGSLLATQAYRAAVITAQCQLKADTLDVDLADTYSAINTATDLAADQSHPSDIGMTNLANCVIPVLT